MTSAEDVARLNRLCDAISEAGTPLDVGQLSASLFLLDLDVVPRRDVVSPDGFTPPTVTVASLFERAATAVDAHDWPTARTLLDVVCAASPHVQAFEYRCFVDVLAAIHEPGGELLLGFRDMSREFESDLRTRVYDLLARGPDAAQPTGKEEF